MTFELEIIGNEKIEKALKVICEDNREKLLKYGFDNSFIKGEEVGNGRHKYYFFCIATNMGATIGLKLGGKKKIIDEMKKKFKELDPESEVREVKFEGK